MGSLPFTTTSCNWYILIESSDRLSLAADCVWAFVMSDIAVMAVSIIIFFIIVPFINFSVL